MYGLTWDCVDFEKQKININKIAKKIEREGYTSDGKRIRGVRGKATTRWYYGSCKNQSSYRIIDIGKTLTAELKKYKEWQDEHEKDYAELYTRYYLKDEITANHRNVQRLIPLTDIGFDYPLERTYPVFIKENGEFHGTDSMKYPSKVINNELGIRFNFHALRHTHATLLMEQNIPVKTISERLGHTSTRTTLDVYAHATQNMKNDAVNIFEKVGNLL